MLRPTVRSKGESFEVGKGIIATALIQVGSDHFKDAKAWREFIEVNVVSGYYFKGRKTCEGVV